VISFLPIACNPQKQVNDRKNECIIIYDSITSKDVYLQVDEMPSFSVDERKLTEYILNNFIYPKQKEYQFTFQLQFIIDPEGKIDGERIRNKSNLALTPAEKELLNIVKKMPDWNPGKCNGRKVPVLITLPLKISLRE
jgi:protein TonB